MLRAALPLGRRAVSAPIGRRKLLRCHTAQCIGRPFIRAFADAPRLDGNTKPNIHNSDAVVLPGSQSQTATAATPPPPGAVPSVSPSSIRPATTIRNSSIPPSNIPLTPPPPPPAKVSIAPPSSVPPPPSDKKSSIVSPPPPPPPLPSKRKPRRFTRFLAILILLTGLGFGGGVWYSLISDNFHDFFTEYIPFGEDAVLYFEEKEFRRRFPRATNPTSRPSTPQDTGHKITIPSKSGLSWSITKDEGTGSDLAKKGRHMSALEENKPKLDMERTEQVPSDVIGRGKLNNAVETAKKDVPPSKTVLSPDTQVEPPNMPPKIETPPKVEAKAKTEPPPQVVAPAKEAEPEQPKVKEGMKAPERSSKGSIKSPEVNEPSVFVPITRIDPLKINDADNTLVQDLVKTLNDIITVVNADNSNGKFNSTIAKAKNELTVVGKKIMDLKAAERATAEQKIKSLQGDFDKAAKELVRRLEDEMHNQEARWKDEFESEREKIAQTYEERLKSEVERTQQLAEQRVRNQLLKQAISMKKQFISDVKERVETERDGRLSKLSELASSVYELEKLTSDWNSVVDANLKTQHLQVAVEAVRAGLEQADRPRPFIKELAALKEISADDPVINSAIASINPVAYQLGVPTSGQIIDRFRRVASEVRKASLLPENAGMASHAASLLLSKVLFKKQGRAVGDDVESVLTRAETLLEEGDFDEAAREMNTLTGWAKTLSGDWLAEVRRVLEVRQALDVIATEARLQSLKVD